MSETITLGPRSVPLLGAALRERCKEPEQQLRCSFLLASLRDDFNEHKGSWTAARYRGSYAIKRAYAHTLLEGWMPASCEVS